MFGKSSFKIVIFLAFKTIDIHTKLIENPIIHFQEVYFFLDRGLPTSWSKYGPQGARQKVNELLIYYPLGKMNIHIIFQGILLLRYVDLDQVC